MLPHSHLPLPSSLHQRACANGSMGSFISDESRPEAVSKTSLERGRVLRSTADPLSLLRVWWCKRRREKDSRDPLWRANGYAWQCTVLPYVWKSPLCTEAPLPICCVNPTTYHGNQSHGVGKPALVSQLSVSLYCDIASSVTRYCTGVARVSDVPLPSIYTWNSRQIYVDRPTHTLPQCKAVQIKLCCCRSWRRRGYCRGCNSYCARSPDKAGRHVCTSSKCLTRYLQSTYSPKTFNPTLQCDKPPNKAPQATTTSCV